MQKESFGRRLYRMLVRAELQGREPVGVVGMYRACNPAQYRVMNAADRSSTIVLTLLWLLLACTCVGVGLWFLPAALRHDPAYGFDESNFGAPQKIIAGVGLLLLFLGIIYMQAGIRWMIRNFKTTNYL